MQMDGGTSMIDGRGVSPVDFALYVMAAQTLLLIVFCSVLNFDAHTRVFSRLAFQEAKSK